MGQTGGYSLDASSSQKGIFETAATPPQATQPEIVETDAAKPPVVYGNPYSYGYYPPPGVGINLPGVHIGIH